MTVIYVLFNTFDGYPVSKIQLQNLNMDAKIPEHDENNFRFLIYEEIEYKDIMGYYVREYIED